LRQKDFRTALVLDYPPADFLGQPEVVWEFRKVGTVHAVFRLIGILADVHFLFGFRQFGHTVSLRKSMGTEMCPSAREF
jgi:hypothetical protein